MVYTLSNLNFLVNSFNFIRSEQVRVYVFGWPSAGLLVLLMGVNMAVGIIFGVISLYTLIRNCCKSANKSKNLNKSNKVSAGLPPPNTIKKNTPSNNNHGEKTFNLTKNSVKKKPSFNKHPLNANDSFMDSLN